MTNIGETGLDDIVARNKMDENKRINDVSRHQHTQPCSKHRRTSIWQPQDSHFYPHCPIRHLTLAFFAEKQINSSIYGSHSAALEPIISDARSPLFRLPDICGRNASISIFVSCSRRCQTPEEIGATRVKPVKRTRRPSGEHKNNTSRVDDIYEWRNCTRRDRNLLVFFDVLGDLSISIHVLGTI